MARNYYLILGVGSDATLEQIKSAYRKEAKRLHPDHSGEGSERFLALQEAYEILCDPGRRQAYDDELARQQQRARPATGERGPESLRGRRCPVEPLVPTRQPSESHSPFSQSPIPSLVREFFGGPERGQDAPTLPRDWEKKGGEIHVPIALSWQQARHGGRIRIWLPLEKRCPTCRGWGQIDFFACPHCLGSGAIVDEYPLDIAFDGGVVDGTEARVSLGRLGKRDLALRLHFKVHEW